MPDATISARQLLIALDQSPANILDDVELLELLQAFPSSGCYTAKEKTLLRRRLQDCLRVIERLIFEQGSFNEVATAVDRSDLDKQIELACEQLSHAARLRQAMQRVTKYLNGVFVVTLKIDKCADHEKVLCINMAGELVLPAQATDVTVGILKLMVSEIVPGMYEQLVSEDGSLLDADAELVTTLLKCQPSSPCNSVPGLHRKNNVVVQEPSSHPRKTLRSQCAGMLSRLVKL
jgi:hypothetical protein